MCMECININRSGKSSADELSKISQWEDWRLKLLSTEHLRSSHLKMNCQHEWKYSFPEAIFKILRCPGTSVSYASVSDYTRLFNTMNVHMRPSASTGERKTNVCHMSEGCFNDCSTQLACWKHHEVHCCNHIKKER